MPTALALRHSPSWGPIGEEVFNRTYSRTNPDGSRETWADTVARVVSSNLALAPSSAIEPGEEAALLYLIGEMSLLPAGRHLWAGGAKTKLGLFNCHRAGWGSALSDHFSFLFDQLMLGGGVGANYSSEYLRALPKVENRVHLVLRLDGTHPDYEECSPHLQYETTARTDYVIEDSREGWVKAIQLTIDAHTVGFPICLVLDASAVRERGSRINGFGGIASGPGPLLGALRAVNRVLNGLVGEHLTPLAAMEVDHELASCVISGNVRRSARMSILHWEDPFIWDFLKCKEDSALHWSTNISVEVDDSFFSALGVGDSRAVNVLHEVARRMVENGEPGFYNSALAAEEEVGDVRSTNPCGEIPLEEWEQCCLGHVNLAAFAHDPDSAAEAFRLMARFLMRATLSKASDPRQEAVKARNRRIGVGFTGFHDWAALQGYRYSEIPESEELKALLARFRAVVDSEAEAYAEVLGVNVPIKTTTVAPTGSISKLPGVSEGIQPPFSRYFIRRVRYASSDPEVARLAALGYEVEPCLYSPDTLVVSFPCRDEIMDKVPAHLVEASNEVSVEDYLRIQEMVQEVYASNAISITVNFERSSTSWEEVAALMALYLPGLKGLTLMPEDGRPQSPYERITEGDYLLASHHEVGQAFEDCATGACPIR